MVDFRGLEGELAEARSQVANAGAIAEQKREVLYQKIAASEKSLLAAEERQVTLQESLTVSWKPSCSGERGSD